MREFDRIVQAELKKGYERYGVPFREEFLKANGQDIPYCIKKEAVGVWLYAGLQKGIRSKIKRLLAKLIFYL